ncbi:unnamed protein product [Arabidopsis arenosa]|uniref:Uncharacterized protein n=1 Tax=Arabidopsis arenosa TaxID=38785 RepID=A0A8S2ASK2_ARAAE|nr:unnamed protein product [Arabidopsis arenosa]
MPLLLADSAGRVFLLLEAQLPMRVPPWTYVSKNISDFISFNFLYIICLRRNDLLKKKSILQQTDPPSIHVLELFPSEDFPEGEIQQYKDEVLEIRCRQCMHLCKSTQSIVVDPKSAKKTISKEESAKIAKEKGNQAFKDKQWQKAIGLYSEAIKLSDNNATYYSNRAAAYLEVGGFLQAKKTVPKPSPLTRRTSKPIYEEEPQEKC